MTQLSAGKLWGMRRMADRDGRFKMLAVDQRPPIKNPIAAYHGVDEAPFEDVARFKRLLIETLQDSSSAVLLDPHYAVPGGLDILLPEKGLIVTLEDSLFDESPEGRLSHEIDDWSSGKIKRMGGDAVKVLAWYRPDAAAQVVAAQRDFVRRIGEDCARLDIPFLLELLVYPLASDSESASADVTPGSRHSELVLQGVREFAQPGYGVDLFKLESPVAGGAVPGVGEEGWEPVQEIFDEMGRLADRPWVMLSAGATKETFRRVLTHAYRAGASGYLAGRAIWLDAFGKFPDWQGMRRDLAGESVAYMRSLNELTDANATRWWEHPCYDGAASALHQSGSDFRHRYPGFDA